MPAFSASNPSMRELEHSLSKIASLPPPPDHKGKASGSARKKFNRMQYYAGGLIGSDILRGLIAFVVPSTCSNLQQFAIAVAKVGMPFLKRGIAALTNLA